MTSKQLWKSTCASIALAGMLTNTVAVAAVPAVTLATSTNTVGASLAHAVHTGDNQTVSKLDLIRRKIKYVFVLFQENRSFDQYFGTYPGANGLQQSFPGYNPQNPMQVPANQTASYTQNIQNTDGSWATVTPFLIPRTIIDVNNNPVSLYPEDTYSVDHSHTGMVASMHFDTETASASKNDAYAIEQEGLEYLTDSSSTANGNIVKVGTTLPPANVPPTSYPSLAQKQEGELKLAHVDCDTIPALWQYADRFVLFDNFHQTVIGPSTPNAIAMISAQTGATQWALHSSTTGVNAGNYAPYAVPNETDSTPYPGSAYDTWSGKPPLGPDEESFASCAVKQNNGYYNNSACPTALPPAVGVQANQALVALKGTPGAYNAPQIPLTYASLPLSFMGSNVDTITAQDTNPTVDLTDVQQDIQVIAMRKSVNWGWYQQGFGTEPFDGTATVDLQPTSSNPTYNTPHTSYIVHHNGPQYFGYLGDNPAEVANMHSLGQFYTDVANGNLPSTGGVFFVRGGYYNNDNLTVLDPSPSVQATFPGNDDHPAYSDAQISEALVADSVNAIANSPYWSQSAIIITYDETDGLYDHVPEVIRNWGPDGEPMSGGPRIPTIVISPYAAAHTVSHTYSEHGSVIKFINEVFGLRPLSALPDEVRAQKLGAKNASLNSRNGAQTQLAPNDGDAVGDLTEAFDSDRLSGTAPPIPASYAIIAAEDLYNLPQFGGQGCTALNITPTDYPNGYGVGLENDPPPADFNPRPTVSPGIPYLEETIVNGNITQPWTP